jgi:hypothetical protein
MSKSFKYPLLTLFFDTDNVACTFLDEVVKQFPDKKKELEEKSWDIEREVDNKIFTVLAVADIEEIINPE